VSTGAVFTSCPVWPAGQYITLAGQWIATPGKVAVDATLGKTEMMAAD
jgi:hypothetical protein